MPGQLNKVGEAIDKLISVEITGRGVVGVLYEAARAAQGDGPMAMRVAAALAERVKQKDVVLICTGMPTLLWEQPEQDGPVGAATLARALVLAFGARPVILTGELAAQACRAAVVGAGLNCSSLDEAMRRPTTAAVVAYPVDHDEAEAAAPSLLEKLEPKAIVSIEMAGASEHGRYHNALGRDISGLCAKVDVLIEQGKKAGILTVGVGDGGNEIGCAWIKDTVVQRVPGAGRCVCGCGGTVVPAVMTDMFIMCAVSNWGAYGIEAGLASILERPEVLHDREVDLRTHSLCAAAGANNNGPGLLDPGTDAVPAAVHGAWLDVLHVVVRANLDPGRLYRNPRYPWLYPSE